MAKKTSKKKSVAKAKKPAVKKKPAAKAPKPAVKKEAAAKTKKLAAKKSTTPGPYPDKRAVHCRNVVYASVEKKTSLPFDDQSVLGELMDPTLVPNLASDINTGVPLPEGFRFKFTDIKPSWTVGQLVLQTIARDKAAWNAGKSLP